MKFSITYLNMSVSRDIYTIFSPSLGINRSERGSVE